MAESEVAVVPPDVLPVSRTKDEARRFYDRISKVYDLLTAAFERQHAAKALERLGVREGEVVLEIGFGSGYCLDRIAGTVGPRGRACGLDISLGMVHVARERLRRSSRLRRVGLCWGDGAALPFREGAFDAVFMSFTLELFDTPEIPKVLGEVRRVLRPGGRAVVASMALEPRRSPTLRLYEWAHTRWPRYVDCRPIPLSRFLRGAGFAVESRARVMMMGLPGEIALAVPERGR